MRPREVVAVVFAAALGLCQTYSMFILSSLDARMGKVEVILMEARK